MVKKIEPMVQKKSADGKLHRRIILKEYISNIFASDSSHLLTFLQIVVQIRA